MVHTYRDLLQCEALRQRVFAGEISPLIFGEPEQWVAKVIEALRVDASGQLDKAQQLRLEAFEDAPTTAGTVDGVEFEWIADADSRIGPFLEAVINGRYYWVPFNRLSEIRCEEPEDLRDFVWTPAQFFLENGGQTVGFIPTRYSGSEAAEDDLVRLARKTEWDEVAEGVYAGLGQRMLVTDRDEYPLLEVRNLVLANADGGS